MVGIKSVCGDYEISRGGNVFWCCVRRLGLKLGKKGGFEKTSCGLIGEIGKMYRKRERRSLEWNFIKISQS